MSLVTQTGQQSATNVGIAKITDTGDNILISCDLKSFAAVTAAGGVINGTATFDNNGMSTGAAGSVSFTNFTGNALLRNEGQIVVKVSTNAMSEYDNAATVSGSTGPVRAVGSYLLATATSASSQMARVYTNSTNQFRGRVHGSDTELTTKMTSVGKDTYVEVCLWFKGNSWGIYTDGAPLISGTRANFNAEAFYKIIVGAGYDGTSTPMVGYKIKDLVVSKVAPRLFSKQKTACVGLFGDSFVLQMADAVASPYWDATGYDQIIRRFAQAGNKTRVVIDGYSGYTVCDTLSSNLSAEIAGFVATQPSIAVIIGSNNDVDLSAGDWTTYAEDPSTGIDANYKDFIDQLAFTDYPTNTVSNGKLTKIYITTPGSVKQATTKDTAQAAINIAAIRTIINALPAWFDAAYPTLAGLVEVEDLHAVLGGDQTVNYNYKGQWDLDGNVTTGAGTLDDRHPHPTGQVKVINSLCNKILRFP